MNGFIVFFLCLSFSVFAVGSDTENMLRVQGKYGDVVYSNRGGDEWGEVAIRRKDGVVIDLFQGKKIRFLVLMLEVRLIYRRVICILF